MTNLIKVSCSVITDFTASPTSGFAPLHIVFSDASTPAFQGSAYHWESGDGDTSNTAMFANHTYDCIGTFTVSLTMTHPCGVTDDTVKNGFIQVLDSTGMAADTDNDGFGDACCCIGTRGDINYDGVDLDMVDLTCIIDFLFGTGCARPCSAQADPNGDGSVADIVDPTFIVDWLFGAPLSLVSCP